MDLSALDGSPYQRLTGFEALYPRSSNELTTSSPTFKQSESLPPNTEIIRYFRFVSTACFLDNSVQSLSWSTPPFGITSGLTPTLSAITSSAKSGLERVSFLFASLSKKSISSLSTETSCSLTRSSVVPITEHSPIGIT